MQRRTLLSLALAPLAATGASQAWAGPAEMPRFLLVFLRGAYDANSLLVPCGSAHYYEARPRLAIARPGSGEGAATALDADWGLAPAVTEPLLPLWQARELAFVPFAGVHDLSRSHFETQDTFELGQGTGGSRDLRSGFLNRLAGQLGLNAQAPAGRQPLAFTDTLPLVFQGRQAVTNASLRSNTLAAWPPEQAALIERMYGPTRWKDSVHSGFETRSEVMREMVGEMQAASRNAIAAKGFELEAQRMGRLMRERVALGFIDVGGWDTHANQGAALGTLATRLGELARGLAAFREAMGPAMWRQTVVVVASEFGRTFKENGTRGTDHGHGSSYWVLGGGLNGGRIVGEQQALRADTLHQKRDTPVLNEYRALLAGLWARQYGLGPSQLGEVFAGVAPRDLGLV